MPDVQHTRSQHEPGPEHRLAHIRDAAALHRRQLISDSELHAVIDAGPELDGTGARVIALYEQWTKAGAPPLGTLMARWWDARLAEMLHAIRPPASPREEAHDG